jgi:hypothetical protein
MAGNDPKRTEAIRTNEKKSLSVCRVLYVFALLALLSACNGWPAYEAKARKHFVENRDSFERLAKKMRATDYWRVSIAGTNVNVTPSADGDYEDQFVIGDDPEWHELLVDVGMFMVLQSDDGAVWTDPGYLWGERENQMGHNGFTHDPDLLDEFVLCKPEHEQVPCGRCAVALEDDWYVHYIWYPDIFSQEEWGSYMNGELSLEDYNASLEIALKQCYIDGYTEMGYDINKIFDLEGS